MGLSVGEISITLFSLSKLTKWRMAVITVHTIFVPYTTSVKYYLLYEIWHFIPYTFAIYKHQNGV